MTFGQEILFELWDWDPGFPGVQNDDPLGRCGYTGSFRLFRSLFRSVAFGLFHEQRVQFSIVFVRFFLSVRILA